MRSARPALAALAAAGFCAVLQGAVTAKVAPDANWPACTAVTLSAAGPFALLLGAVFAVVRPAAAADGRGPVVGAALGFAVFLAPVVTVWLPGPELVVALLLLGGAVTYAFVRAGGPPPTGLEVAGQPLLSMGFLALSLVLSGLAYALPEPPLALGEVPAAEDRQKVSDAMPNVLLLVDGTTPPGEYAALLLGEPVGVEGVPTGRDVQTLATRLADRGFANAAVVGETELRRVRRFSRGFHRYDDALVSPVGVAAAHEASATTAPVVRVFGGWMPAPAPALPAAAADVDARAQTLLQDGSLEGPFFLLVAARDRSAEELEALRAAFVDASAERPWRLYEPSGAGFTERRDDLATPPSAVASAPEGLAAALLDALPGG